MGTTKEKVIMVILSTLLSLSSMMIFYSFTKKDNKIEDAAPIEYVDKCDDEIKQMFIAADSELKKEIEKKADIPTVNKIQQDVDYTRDRVDEIYLILIEDR
jgi:hypothetical protein